MKIFSLTFALVVMFSFLVIPTTQAAELGANQRAQLSTSLGQLRISLSSILTEIRTDAAAMRMMANQLAVLSAHLNILDDQNIDTEAEEDTAEQVIANVSTGVEAISDKLELIANRREAQVSILAKISAAFGDLIDIIFD